MYMYNVRVHVCGCCLHVQHVHVQPSGRKMCTCARGVFQGEDIFRRLQSALRRGKVKVRIAQNEPSPAQPQNDSRLLQELGKDTARCATSRRCRRSSSSSSLSQCPVVVVRSKGGLSRVGHVQVHVRVHIPTIVHDNI